MGSSKTHNKGSIWVYDKLVTNVGNAYNPSTGKFTAPSNGTYQFNPLILDFFQTNPKNQKKQDYLMTE